MSRSKPSWAWFTASRRTRPCALLAVLALVAAASAHAAGPLRVAVDATEAPRKILHARLSLPVDGPITLVYPKWLPGEHGPTGPIVDLAGLRFTTGGRVVPWRRDDVDMYAFHVQMPPGARTLDVALDFLLPAATQGYSSGASATDRLVVINWNQVMLYPQGADPAALTCEPSLRLPAGWKWGSALQGGGNGPELRFDPVSLVRLVDSPVLAGANFRSLPLTRDDPRPVTLDMACDSRAGLAIADSTVLGLRRLVSEAGALFGARHYDRYHFLLTLSDHTAHFGLEHHESSDDRVDERTLINPDLRLVRSGLLPHEYVHSWNGKYRRPAGLATPDYQAPMRGALLWVYEGLTQYLAHVLTARSGLLTPDQSRQSLALLAAALDTRPGRAWRPLDDTAIAAQILYGSPPGWASWRRGTDFYNEGVLIWLDADVLIRRLTHGQRSLDDFCRVFEGPPGGSPKVVPYTFEDVVQALNQVAPHDWAAFLHQRLESTAPHAPLGGLEGSGWRLVYRDSLPPYLKSQESGSKQINLVYSIGMTVDNDGGIIDAIPDMPAARAGIGPGMHVIAVNGRRYSKDVLLDAVRASRTEPLELLVDNGEFVHAHRLDYHGGRRYPWLERIPGSEDLLSAITAPHAGR